MAKNFEFKKGDVDKIIGNMTKAIGVFDNDLQQKMTAAVAIVYATARARRPKIGLTKYNKGQYRVSDPNATLGVPVKTGALQGSINREITQKGGKIQGRIFTNIPYAVYMEYGTSRIEARPFMRPALNENAEKVKNIFSKKIDHI